MEVEYKKTEELSERMASVFNVPELSDVVVSCSAGQEFHCLKALLCSGSDVFAAMFNAGMQESASNRVVIENADPAGLEQMLKMIHTGCCGITESNLVPLKALADRYNVKELLNCCSNFEERLELNEESSCRLFARSVDLNVESVVQKCQRYIFSEMGNMCDSRHFLALSCDLVVSLKNAAMDTLFGGRPGDSKVCRWFILGIVRWVEKNLHSQHSQTTVLLHDLDFEYLNREQLCHIASYRCIKESHAMCMIVLKCMSEARRTFDNELCKGVKKFKHANVWETVRIERNSWYSITACGGAGGTKMNGAFLTGSVFLRKGSKLEMLIGRDVKGTGGGSCVILCLMFLLRKQIVAPDWLALLVQN